MDKRKPYRRERRRRTPLLEPDVHKGEPRFPYIRRESDAVKAHLARLTELADAALSTHENHSANAHEPHKLTVLGGSPEERQVPRSVHSSAEGQSHSQQ
jgi:hypothetical protein